MRTIRPWSWKQMRASKTIPTFSRIYSKLRMSRLTGPYWAASFLLTPREWSQFQERVLLNTTWKCTASKATNWHLKRKLAAIPANTSSSKTSSRILRAIYLPWPILMTESSEFELLGENQGLMSKFKKKNLMSIQLSESMITPWRTMALMIHLSILSLWMMRTSS